MRHRNHSTTRPALISALVLAWSLISVLDLGAVLAAGLIRTQPSRSAPIPPLPVASSAVTPAPRNPAMTALIDQLESLGSSAGLSVEQESELITAAIRVFKLIGRDPNLTRQEQDLFIRETGELVVTIAGTRSRSAGARTEVSKVLLETVALVIAAPHLDMDEKKEVFQFLGEEVFQPILEAGLTDQKLIEIMPLLKREIARLIDNWPPPHTDTLPTLPRPVVLIPPDPVLGPPDPVVGEWGSQRSGSRATDRNPTIPGCHPK